MATLTEALVHGVDLKHDKNDFIYIGLDKGAFGAPVLRIWDSKSGQGIEADVKGSNVRLEQRELVRYTANKDWDDFATDMHKGAENLAKQGYKVRVLEHA